MVCSWCPFDNSSGEMLFYAHWGGMRHFRFFPPSWMTSLPPRLIIIERLPRVPFPALTSEIHLDLSGMWLMQDLIYVDIPWNVSHDRSDLPGMWILQDPRNVGPIWHGLVIATYYFYFVLNSYLFFLFFGRCVGVQIAIQLYWLKLVIPRIFAQLLSLEHIIRSQSFFALVV